LVFIYFFLFYIFFKGGFTKDAMNQPRDVDKLNSHLLSTHHKEAVKGIKEGVIPFFLTNKNEENIKYLLHQIIFLTSNNLPVYLLPKLSFLIFQISRNKNLYNFGHTSNGCCWELIYLIYTSFLKVLVSGIRNSPFFGITLDGTVDISKKEQYSVYVHWLNNTIKMEHFLGIITPKSTDATTLKTELDMFLIERNLDVNKLLTITTDSGSNLLGVNNGLSSKYIQNNSRILAVSCFAHRFNNMVKESFSSVSIFVECENLITTVINHFNHSPSKLRKLREIQKQLHGKEMSLIIKNDTRWTSFGSSVRSYTNSIQSIIQYFEKHSSADSNELKMQVVSFTHIIVILLIDLIWDVLCLTFDRLQQSDISILERQFEVESCVVKINQMYENVNDTIFKVKNQCKNFFIFVKNDEFKEELVNKTLKLFSSSIQNNFNMRLFFYII
jgi:hypothetical protein